MPCAGMSQQDVEIWRANVEALLAQLAAGSTPGATISTLAEIWDPRVELDATDGTVLDINAVHGHRGPVREVRVGQHVQGRVGRPREAL